MTSALIGSRTVKQLNECLDSLNNYAKVKGHDSYIDIFHSVINKMNDMPHKDLKDNKDNLEKDFELYGKNIIHDAEKNPKLLKFIEDYNKLNNKMSNISRPWSNYDMTSYKLNLNYWDKSSPTCLLNEKIKEEKDCTRAKQCSHCNPDNDSNCRLWEKKEGGDDKYWGC